MARRRARQIQEEPLSITFKGGRTVEAFKIGYVDMIRPKGDMDKETVKVANRRAIGGLITVLRQESRRMSPEQARLVKELFIKPLKYLAGKTVEAWVVVVAVNQANRSLGAEGFNFGEGYATDVLYTKVYPVLCPKDPDPKFWFWAEGDFYEFK